MKPTFQERLGRLLEQGNLTIADLARWLDRPHPTVSGWVRGTSRIGRELAPLDAAWVEAQVARMERILRKRQGLPVPRMKRADRQAYLSNLKQDGASSF